MKKVILFIFLLLISRSLPAPGFRLIYVARAPLIRSYEPLIRAVVAVESESGKRIFNKEENAVGYFQIRPIRVRDYNQRTGSSYKLKEFYNYELSRKVFLYYAEGKDYEKAAKDWNGSGKKTKVYWKKVKAQL